MRPPPRWLAALGLFQGAWMTFDGARALLVGDYVRMEGQLGPWAPLVEAVGIHPLSLGMKLAFVVLGLAWLAVAGAYAWRPARLRGAFAAMCVATLWYLPFGTLFGLVGLAALAWTARRA